MARIVSTGSYLPKKIVTNENFGKPANPEELAVIEKYMTGMKERRHASSEESGICMAVEAAKIALSKSDYAAGDIDFIVGNITPNEYLLPEDLNIVARELGCVNSIVIPINTACSSFLTGLNLASMMTNKGKKVLVINSTNWVNYIIDKNRDYSMFGDGAGVVLVDGEGDSLISVEESSDQRVFHTMCMKSPVFTGKPEYFVVKEDESIDMIKDQIQKPIHTARELLRKTDIIPKWFIAHQAGVGMLEYWLEQIELDVSLLKHTFDKYGNMMSANIPVTLAHWVESGDIRRGDMILFFSPAAGAHYISMLWRY